MPTPDSKAHAALEGLLSLVSEASTRWASEEWNLLGPYDFADARRALLHTLEGGLVGYLETDPARPEFRRIVTTYRKYTGDNADAIYFDAPVSPEYEYIVRGRMGRSVYTSFTVELNTADGTLGQATAGVINDGDFDVDENGCFEFHVGGAKRDGAWLELPEGASRITTRHYYEDERCGAADPTNNPLLTIEVVGGPAVTSEPVVSDEGIAEGLKRVHNFVHTRTLGMQRMGEGDPPAFVSKVPNELPVPIVPGDTGLAAIDAHYSMAPYLCPEDQAVVITGRWPEACRMANVNLWTRQMQTYDYVNRQVSLNRKQTHLEADGSWRIVIAHEDPGVPNWLDTEGRMIGLVFFRYMLAKGEVVTPKVELVPLDQLRG